MPRLADPLLPERRRAQILDAARTCFRERGFHTTTIEEICAEAGMSPGALYRYFGSKADLVAAIALDARSAIETMLQRLTEPDRLIDGLADAAEAFFNTFEKTADAALLVDIWAEAARDASLARVLARRERTALGLLTSTIERGTRAGLLHPSLSAEEIAEILMAAVEGIALRRILSPGMPVTGGVRRLRSLALHLLKPKR